MPPGPPGFNPTRLFVLGRGPCGGGDRVYKLAQHLSARQPLRIYLRGGSVCEHAVPRRIAAGVRFTVRLRTCRRPSTRRVSSTARSSAPAEGVSHLIGSVYRNTTLIKGCRTLVLKLFIL